MFARVLFSYSLYSSRRSAIQHLKSQPTIGLKQLFRWHFHQLSFRCPTTKIYDTSWPVACDTKLMFSLIYGIVSIRPCMIKYDLGTQDQLPPNITKRIKLQSNPTVQFQAKIGVIRQDLDYNLNLVLHISPMTFFGCGLSGPLSRCPDVKYNHPSQKPASVVFTRKGSFPITDHVSESR